MRKITTIIVAAALSVGVAACGEGKTEQQKAVDKHAAGFKAYLPHNDVELHNYNRAQQLYDSPNTIIWCTSAFSNPSAPIITTPVAGKLTSSSTTFFPPEREVHVDGDGANPLGVARSVDGLFHPNPPPYRYGFTPGGQYIDYFGVEVQCTTALTKVQRQKTLVDVSPDAEALRKTADAERLLKAGKPAAAQQALQGLGH